MLRAERYAVDWVRDGDMADQALRTERYDLVLLDLGLPRRDGLEVLRALRARRDTVPVLIVTARDALDQQLWDDFHARRLPRAKAVVEASVQLGQWQIDGDRDADAGGLIFGIAKKMAEPA